MSEAEHGRVDPAGLSFGLGSRADLARGSKVIPSAFAFVDSLRSNENVSCEEIRNTARRDAFNAIRKIICCNI